MYNIFKSMKQFYMARFTRKPLARRITNTLCWSLGLIMAALLLSGHFALAFVLATTIALGYLSMMMLCKKMEAISANTIGSTSVYTAKRTVDNVIEALKALLEERNNDESIEKIHDIAESTNIKVSAMNDVLNEHILPEMGIYLSDKDEEDGNWIRCDVLGREIPYGLISLRISNRLNDEGIKTFADLVRCSEKEILYIPDFGPSSLERIKQLLSLMGLHLKMNIKKDDGVWYYLDEQEKFVAPVVDEPLTAEDEILADETEKGDIV